MDSKQGPSIFVRILVLGWLVYIIYWLIDCHFVPDCKYTVRGIDVSRWQGKVDWQKTLNDNVSFVFLKSTQGTSHLDPAFKRNWETLEKYDVPKGAYHYFELNSSAAAQAEWFIKNTPLEKGDLPPVLDFEERHGVSKRELIARVGEWLNIVEAHYGVKPIIYVNRYFYHTYVHDYFPDNPIWIAAYDNWRSVKIPQRMPSRWVFWQHSETGRKKGISEKVDLNVFRSDEGMLESLCID